MFNPEILLEARRQVGKYLQSIRIDKNITIEQLSERTGLSISDLENIENNTSVYSFDDFLKITTGLDVYFYLADRDGKHLDHKDLIDKSDISKAST